MQYNNHNFRKFLRSYRSLKDITQREMALKLKVSGGYLSAVEGGKRRLTAKFLGRLMVGFNFREKELDRFLTSIERDLGYVTTVNRQDVRIATIIGFLEVNGEALDYIRKVSKEMDTCQ